MPRSYIIAGNWKCNGTISPINTLVSTLNSCNTIPPNVSVIVCPTFLHISHVQSSLRKDISIGSQNIGINPQEGAYTGEICARQLKDMNISWSIIGHSERRQMGESHETCATKAKVAIDTDMKVMFAVGETKEDRENKNTMSVIQNQLDPLIRKLDLNDWKKVVLAYEPVWAIGTGLTATPDLAQETHKKIREYIKEKVGKNVSEHLCIQYGGSMKGTNARELLEQEDIDGGLVGGASLKEDFWNIVNSVPKEE